MSGLSSWVYKFYFKWQHKRNSTRQLTTQTAHHGTQMSNCSGYIRVRMVVWLWLHRTFNLIAKQEVGRDQNFCHLNFLNIQPLQSGWHWKKLICLFESYLRPCSAQTVYICTDRSLLTGHDALLLWQIARDLVHALSHRHEYTWTPFVEPVISTGGNKLITRW